MLSKFVTTHYGQKRAFLLAVNQLRLVQSSSLSGSQISDRESILQKFGKKHNLGIHSEGKVTDSNVKSTEKPKKAKSAAPKPPKPPKLPTTDPNIESLRTRLRAAQAARHPYEIEAVMREVLAISSNSSFNALELGAGFEACLAVGNIEMSVLVLNRMKSRGYLIPGEYITRVVQKSHSPDQLHDLMKLVQSLADSAALSKIAKEDYLNKLITSICTVAVTKPEAYTSLIESAYAIYLNLRDTKKLNVKLNKDAFGSLANFYITSQNADKCLEIFQDMSRVGVEPDVRLCEHVLDTAIMNKETKVIRVIATWFSEVFNVPMEYGMAQRILEVAAAKGDGQLAIIAFQLLTKSSITPDRSDYYLLVRSLIKAKDIVSAVEALQDMESRGVSLIPVYSEARAALAPTAKSSDGTVNALELHDKIMDDISAFFIRHSEEREPEELPSQENETMGNGELQESADQSEEKGERDSNKVSNSKSKRYALLEDFYFALIDQVERGQSVPRVVVDAVMIAIGSFRTYTSKDRSIQLMRIRSIFDQYPTVFKLEHDITSHIALIKAARRQATHSEFLTLFQDAEKFIRESKIGGESADALQQQFIVKEGMKVAYSRLFHFMISKRLVFGFSDIWEHMRKEHDVFPDLWVLSRMGEFFSRSGQTAERELVLDAMNEAYKNNLQMSIPKSTESEPNAYVPNLVKNTFKKILEQHHTFKEERNLKIAARESSKQPVPSGGSTSKAKVRDPRQNSR